MKQTKISKKFQKVIDFYNETDQDQKIFFIYTCQSLIQVPIYEGNKVVVYQLDSEAPACPNGIGIQLNTEQFAEKQTELEN